MEPAERIKLQRGWSHLVEDLSVDDVQDLLIQEGVLTLDDRDQIYAGNVTRKECVRRLLQIIVRRGPDAYRTFLDALSDTYPHLCKTLEETHVSPLMKTTHDADILKAQAALKERYHNNALVVKVYPWAERSPHLNVAKLFNRLVLKSRIKGNYVGDVEFEQLFSADTCGTVPQRVLVEGDPGVGKTFLCRKIAYDWGCPTTNKLYFTHTFEFVILIDVRSMRKGFEQAVKSLLCGTPEQKELAFQYMLTHPSQCLFIIDGLDEGCYPEVRSILHALLSGTEFSGAYILATCRSNMANEFSEYFQKEVKNLGFTLSQAKRYIRSFFEDEKEKGESLLRFLQDSEDISSDIQQTPLKCFMLCTWWSDPHRKLPSGRVTMTALYAMMERSILRRYCEKSKIPDDIVVEMKKLYRVALHGMVHGQFQFSPAALLQFDIDDDSRSLRLGFLTREYSVTADEDGEQIYYSFPHLSMQEYLAAKGVEQLDQESQLMFITMMSCQDVYTNVCMYLAGLLAELSRNSLFVCKLLSTENPSLSDSMAHEHCVEALKQAQSQLKKYSCWDLDELDKLIMGTQSLKAADKSVNVLGDVMTLCATLITEKVCEDCRKGSLERRAIGKCLFWCQKLNCEFSLPTEESKRTEKRLILNEFLPGYRKELTREKLSKVNQVLPVAGRWQCVYVTTNVESESLRIDCRNAEGLAWALLHREQGYPINEVVIDMASVGDENGPTEQTVRTIRQQLGMLCDEGLKKITLECEQIRSIAGILPQGKTLNELCIHAWRVDGENADRVLTNIASCRVYKVDITLGSILKVLIGDLCKETLEAITKQGDDLQRNVKNIRIRFFYCIVEACVMEEFLKNSISQYVVFKDADIINIEHLETFHLVLQMPQCTFQNCRLIAKRNIRYMTEQSELMLLYDWTNLRVCPNTWKMISSHISGSAGTVGKTIRLPYVTFDDSLSTFLNDIVPVLAWTNHEWKNFEMMSSSVSVQNIVDTIKKHGGCVNMTAHESDHILTFNFKST